MTVLVTGARGFIGSALFELARNEAKGESNLVGVDLQDADLRDSAAVTRLFERIAPDRVVHLAGKLVKGEGASVLEEQMEHTFRAGTVVLGAAVAAGVRHVVMAGTIDELGSQSGVLSPGSLGRPISYYGLAKSLLHEYASFCARRSELRVDWFRPFIVYGPGQINGNMLLPTAFRAAKSGQPAQFSDGSQERDFIHVQDVASWLLAAVQIDLLPGPGGLHEHHLGTGRAVAVREVLAAISEQFPGARFEVGALPRRPGEPPTQLAPFYESTEPALEGWRPRYDWRAGIAETAGWWKSKDAL